MWRKGARVVFRVVLRVMLIVLLIGTGFLIRVYTMYESRAAQYDLKQLSEVPGKSAVYDVRRQLYSHIQGANRLMVSIDKVSPHFVNALLSREDSSFWDHNGVDFTAILRAVVRNKVAGKIKQGASTLTQQLARERLHLTGRTYDRKLLELMLAFRIESRFSKPQILELYINQVYFGNGMYGVETAARGYFQKPAADLSVGEAAMLAGLIRSPNSLAPTRDLPAAQGAQEEVLWRMMECRRITPEEAAAARAENIHISARRPFEFEENYAVDAVRRELSEILSPDAIEAGGLRIHTAIDPDLQQSSELVLEESLHEVELTKPAVVPKKSEFVLTGSGEDHPTDYLQGAVVVVDNASGGIRAIVGGRDYSQSKFPRALMAKRQLGSTFKPFVYAAAFQGGVRPQTPISDGPLSPGEFHGLIGSWSPKNSDGGFRGTQPAGYGLVHSRNTMTVRVGLAAGLKSVRSVAS